MVTPQADPNQHHEGEETASEYPLKKMEVNKKTFNKGEAGEARCKNYLTNVLAPNCCKGALDNVATTCTCLSFLGDTTEDEVSKVAKFMIHFAGIKGSQQNQQIASWIRVAEVMKPLHRRKSYILPILHEDSGTPDPPPRMICLNALAAVLGIGRRKLTACRKNTDHRHGLEGRAGPNSSRGKGSVGWRASLHSEFARLKGESVPFATRIIREETGETTRDDDPDECCLPPHMSKRRCYERWCHDRGWVPTKKIKAKSQYDAISQFPKRSHDDESVVPLWPSGTESQPICSWTSFIRFWDKNYPNVKVRAKGADTCTDCRIFLNSINFGRELAAEQGEGALEDEVERALTQVEAKRQEALAHVKQYKTQRAFVNECIATARDQQKQKVAFELLHHCLTIDMGQNLGFPHYEAEQVGDTFYFTPITGFVFGVNDNSRSDGSDHLNAYVWHEKDGKRGAANICSCLYKDYKRRGFFNQKNQGSLTVVADNCGGQNKNGDVLRFHVWLVEAGWFPKVQFVFLVKGHTKNACDRMFNLLKHDYHHSNIETFDELMEILNKNPHVDAQRIGPDEFYDFGPTLNRWYRSLEGSWTKRSHVFTIEQSRGGAVLYKKDHAEATKRADNLTPRKSNQKAKYMEPAERAAVIGNMLVELERLEPPGLADIKQVEMYTKWRPILKDKNKDITCPKPPDEILAKIKKDRNAKARKRTAAKSQGAEAAKAAKKQKTTDKDPPNDNTTSAFI